MTEPSATPFRLAFVPGVTPAKWARIWSERQSAALELIPTDNSAQALTLLRADDVDAAIVRTPPTETPSTSAGLNAIPLYAEHTVVVVGKDHLFTAASEVTVDDLAGEPLLVPDDDPLTWADRPGDVVYRPATVGDAVSLVADGVGVLLVPQSLARLHHRRDLTFRTVAEAPETPVALVWTTPSAVVEEFIGIVRGRRPASSRGRSEPAPKRTAREKMLAKRAAREAAGKTPPPRHRGRPPRRG